MIRLFRDAVPPSQRGRAASLLRRLPPVIRTEAFKTAMEQSSVFLRIQALEVSVSDVSPEEIGGHIRRLLTQSELSNEHLEGVVRLLAELPTEEVARHLDCVLDHLRGSVLNAVLQLLQGR